MADWNLFGSAKNEKGPEVNTKGSGRTTCTVLIDTHDKGANHGSQQINLSEHITQVSITQNITGGGSANIMIPPIDFIEDIISAGDLVNIYFNLNRADVDDYNIGNVRTFFGYVESVNKNVTVSGDGSKRTNYSIYCTDFSKAFRNTQIYNNPHLTSQGDSKFSDVIRKELSQNLGGIALYSKGVATSGTPRQLMIRNMARVFGMGGQWVLPGHYDEKIPGANHRIRLTKRTGEQDINISVLKAAVGIKQILKGSSNNAVKTGKEADPTSVFTSSTADEIYKELDERSEEEIKQMARKFGLDLTDTLITYDGTMVANDKGTSVLTDIGNTLFKIGPLRNANKDSSWPTSVSIFDKEILKKDPGNLETHPTEDLKNEIVQVYKETATEIVGITNAFEQHPSLNIYADPAPPHAYQTAKTIFNILSLDYMEDVDGYWGGFRFLTASGSLWSALEQTSNPVVNEFFVDLRPIADFKQRTKDGLGVSMAGAIPMVPAVILREKPFTNYKPPGEEIAFPSINKGLLVGGVKSNKGDGLDQQLFFSSIGPHGSISDVKDNFESASIIGATTEHDFDEITVEDMIDISTYYLRIKEISEKIDTKTALAKSLFSDNQIEIITDLKLFFSTLEFQTIKKEFEASASIFKQFSESVLDNLGDEEKVAKAVNLEAEDISFLKSVFDEASLKILEKNDVFYLKDKGILKEKSVGSIVSLPKPVFRSPDGTRVTVEKKIGTNIGIFGYSSKDSNDPLNNFTAFEASGEGNFPDQTLPYNTGSGKISSILGIGKKESLKNLEEATSSRWHILDSVSVRAQDVISHQYTRGDGSIINFLEITANMPGGIEAQRFFLNNFIPIVSPILVHRFGVRVTSAETKFVQHLASVGSPFQWQATLLIRWGMMLDMWYQHNHEYLSGAMTLRGMPGIRPGYRLDRPDLNLSFYVEGTNHTWTYPGALSTSVTVTRGQPMASDNKLDNVLPYYPPEPMTAAGQQQRQKLGQVFSANKDKDGKKYPRPGTYTGSIGADGLGVKPRTVEAQAKIDQVRFGTLEDYPTDKYIFKSDPD